jgi:hypothetical protein
MVATSDHLRSQTHGLAITGGRRPIPRVGIVVRQRRGERPQRVHASTPVDPALGDSDRLDEGAGSDRAV